MREINVEMLELLFIKRQKILELEAEYDLLCEIYDKLKKEKE